MSLDATHYLDETLVKTTVLCEDEINFLAQNIWFLVTDKDHHSRLKTKVFHVLCLPECRGILGKLPNLLPSLLTITTIIIIMIILIIIITMMILILHNNRTYKRNGMNVFYVFF